MDNEKFNKMNLLKGADKIQENWREKLEEDTALIAYLDLANMFHWQDVLRWRFRIEDVISGLFAISSIKEVKVYHGLDGRNMQSSKAFHKRILKTGAILKTKPVKYIRKNINETFFFKQATMTLFDNITITKVTAFVEEIRRAKITVEEPKCNFDVEITMDILDDMDKISGILLFSGDSDFRAPLERLKVKGKKIYVVGVRGQVASELFKVADQYIDFGKFYTGKKNR